MLPFIHGNNIERKLKTEKIEENIKLLREIKEKYDEWKGCNESITGTSKKDIFDRVKFLNEYKDFIDQSQFKKERGNTYGFTSQSKLHSTVIEEFLYYLFEGMPILSGKQLTLGPGKAYVDMSFSPKNIDEWEKNPGVDIKVKDQDFAIGKEIFCIFSSDKELHATIQKNILVPIVAIECKTYLDKTMLDGASYAAERLKRGNPYALYIVVTETNALDKSINPKHTRIDEIFVLRRQKSGQKPLKPIDAQLVWDLFNLVKDHLEKEWWNPEKATERGRLID